MYRTIAPWPTVYADTRFASRLEAKWAAFFDLAKWEWKYEPVDLVGWTPDFWVRFPCKHHKCLRGWHSLLCEVKPYLRIEQFEDHACIKHEYGKGIEGLADAGASLGVDPRVSCWLMTHGYGGGEHCVTDFVPNWKFLWGVAHNLTRYSG